MKVVVLHESLFGNTREVAEAIAEGIAEDAPDAQVVTRRVGEADRVLVEAADLLVVGGPTHMHGMTSGLSRRIGLAAEQKEPAAGGEHHEPEPGAEGPGVRDWLHDLPAAAPGRHAAAFDTRGDFRMAGGAAPGIARRLHRHGYQLIGEPEGFVVEGTEGPLRPGERDRAKAWGAELVRRTASAPGPAR